jgi:hypothetical protein
MKTTTGTADFGRPKADQRLNVGEYNQKDECIDNFEVEGEEEGQCYTMDGEILTEWESESEDIPDV